MTNPQGFPSSGSQPPMGRPHQQQGSWPGQPPQHQQPPQASAPPGPPYDPPSGRPAKSGGRKALPFVIIGAVVVLALAAVLIRAALVVGADEYGRANTALLNLEMHRSQITQAAARSTGEAFNGIAPTETLGVDELRNDLAAARDSGADRDKDVSAALDQVNGALTAYATGLENQQKSLPALAQMMKECDAYVEQHRLIAEESTEAQISGDIAACEKATGAAASEENLAEVTQTYTTWIKSQKETAAQYERYAASRDLTAYERAIDIEATGNEKLMELTDTRTLDKVDAPLPQLSRDLGGASEAAREVITAKMG